MSAFAVLEIFPTSALISLRAAMHELKGSWMKSYSGLVFPCFCAHLCVPFSIDTFMQGQARGYGRITHFLPSPEVGHDFHKVTVTQQVGQFKIPGCQMKDMDFVFPQIPFGLL